MVGSYYFLITFLTAHGLDGKAFLQQLFGTQISTFFAVDLLASSVVYLIALLTVGLSFALPLFLYVREDCMESHVSGS